MEKVKEIKAKNVGSKRSQKMINLSLENKGNRLKLSYGDRIKDKLHKIDKKYYQNSNRAQKKLRRLTHTNKEYGNYSKNINSVDVFFFFFKLGR